MTEMPLSQEEAFDLLSKWIQEKRIIHVSIAADGITGKILGRLDDVNLGAARLSLTKSTFSAGPHIFLNLSLSDCTFGYSDAERAPEPMRSELKDYDALLYIYRPGVVLGLAVLPFGELPQF